MSKNTILIFFVIYQERTPIFPKMVYSGFIESSMTKVLKMQSPLHHKSKSYKTTSVRPYSSSYFRWVSEGGILSAAEGAMVWSQNKQSTYLNTRMY
jgi:hypothetical protein